MFKHFIFIVIVSTVAVFFKNELAYVLHGLLFLHNQIASALAFVFSDDAAGQVIQSIIALIVIPLVAGGIAAIIFYFVKREAMPHTMTTIWVVWTVLLVTMLAQIG
ncbi:MAG: hypothetical protein K0U12_00055 [Gammaproteobacteria bacterium]|nr:hypothetical protein [Gammaproteobacteria bacterium]